MEYVLLGCWHRWFCWSSPDA